MKSKLNKSTKMLEKNLIKNQDNGSATSLKDHIAILKTKIEEYKKQSKDLLSEAAADKDPASKQVKTDTANQLKNMYLKLIEQIKKLKAKSDSEQGEISEVKKHKNRVAGAENIKKNTKSKVAAAASKTSPSHSFIQKGAPVKTPLPPAKTPTNSHSIGIVSNIVKPPSSQAGKISKGVESAVGIAQTCTNAFFSSVPPTFCWKKGADVGIVPTGCPKGYFRYLALCIQDCKSGYSFDGGLLCIKNCPPNTTTYALTCTHWDALVWNDWTVGRDPYAPHSITNFDVPCPSGYYKGGALCYRDCGKIGLVNCGIGMCAASREACAAGIAEMVANVLASIAQGVAFVLSFGASSAATEAVDEAKSALTKLGDKALNMITEGAKTIKRIATDPAARNAFMKKMLLKAVDKAVDAAANKVISTICSQVGNALLDKAKAPSSGSGFSIKSLDVFGIGDIVDGCSNIQGTNGSIACAGSVLNAISVVDPTGLAGLASAFMQPICDV